MSKPTQTVLLSCLLAILPLVANAQQTCKSANIPATTPTSQFTDHADGTVTDNKTGLMWKKCAEGQDSLTCSGSAASFNWQAALQRAQDVNSGTAGSNLNYADWRVPNIKELASIVEEQCESPSINTAVFPTERGRAKFWSSSPVAANDNFAWLVGFDDGYEYWGGKSSALQFRLVRSGQ